MKSIMTKLAGLGLAAVAALGLGGVAFADYPDKPLTLVVSFPAGGNADIVARIQAEALSDELGVPVNVVNRPGGAHIPATMSVVEAPADGYTLFNWSPPSFMVVPLTRATPYQPLEDFVPLFAGISASNALYVRGDSPINTFEEFIAHAKENKLKMGVNGMAAPPNLSAVQLADQFGLEFTTIALKTVPGSLNGLIAGEVDVAVGQVASLNGFGDAIKPLIILDNTRKPFYEKDLPGVRTVGEAVPGKEAGAWVHGGFAVKAGTPDDVIQTLSDATKAAFDNDAFRASIPSSITWYWVHGTEDTTALIQSGRDLYSPILDSIGLLHK
jgi:tripartite-type tricarboxylate transporter receptor subunit TctC